MTKGVSLASLDARKASDQPVEFEYYGPDLKPTGVFFSVLGAQSQKVVEQTAKLLNERRKRDASQAAMRNRPGSPSDAAFTPVEDDIAFGQQLSAVRLVGWRGIEEEFTAERGLALIASNAHVKDQIDAVSNDLAGFMKSSPKA